LIDRRWHSSILDVHSFWRAGCGTDHYLEVTKVRGRTAISKQAAEKSDVEIFNLRKLSELEIRKKQQCKNLEQVCSLEELK